MGRAANLNDDQITELAKLPLGVAAVYQNEWIQPVLCKVNCASDTPELYHYEPGEDVFSEKESQKTTEDLLEVLMNRELQFRDRQTEFRSLKESVIRSKLPADVKIDFVHYLNAEDSESLEALRKLVYDFLSANTAIKESAAQNDIVMWSHSVVNRLNPSIKHYSNQQINLALALVVYEQWQRDAEYGELFCRFAEKYAAEGGVY